MPGTVPAPPAPLAPAADWLWVVPIIVLVLEVWLMTRLLPPNIYGRPR